jgi:hypothetical protein
VLQYLCEFAEAQAAYDAAIAIDPAFANESAPGLVRASFERVLQLVRARGSLPPARLAQLREALDARAARPPVVGSEEEAATRSRRAVRALADLQPGANAGVFMHLSCLGASESSSAKEPPSFVVADAAGGVACLAALYLTDGLSLGAGQKAPRWDRLEFTVVDPVLRHASLPPPAGAAGAAASAGASAGEGAGEAPSFLLLQVPSAQTLFVNTKPFVLGGRAQKSMGAPMSFSVFDR